MADEGYSRQGIVERLAITFAQVRYNLKANDLTPTNRLGQALVLSTAQVDKVKAFVGSSSENGQISFEFAH